jgi:hypothetical protein
MSLMSECSATLCAALTYHDLPVISQEIRLVVHESSHTAWDGI